MRTHPRFTLLAASLACMFAQTAPITIEADEATIIVVRPLDQWSGDKALLRTALKPIKLIHF